MPKSSIIYQICTFICVNGEGLVVPWDNDCYESKTAMWVRLLALQNQYPCRDFTYKIVRLINEPTQSETVQDSNQIFNLGGK